MSDMHFEEEEFNSQFNGATVMRVLRLATRHWRLLLGFLVCISAVALIESYRTYLGKQLIDNGIIAGDEGALRSIAILYGATFLFQSALVFGFIYLAGVLGERLSYDMRKAMFNRLQELSLAYFDRTALGWIMSRVTSDTTRVADLVSWGLLDITWAVVSIITAVIFMLLINWQLALIVFSIIPVLIIIAAQFKKRILDEYRKVRKLNSQITGNYAESINGVRVTKALRREEANLAEFSTLTEEMYTAGYRAAWLSALFMPVVQIISAGAIAAIAWYGGWQTQRGGLTIGGIQAFVGYVTFMLWPVLDLARVYAEMQHAIASAERIFSLIDEEPQIRDRDHAIAAQTLAGEIVFEQVNFAYDPAKPVLKDFNLRVQPGETIALVGATGSGKSTIVNLLCRFYEPTSGRITIAGHDYTELMLHSIHSRIGMVLQTPHLFSGSIRDNIRYGRLEASDAEIEAAAQVAGAHTFIITLEQGYDAEVGEGGNLLSLGQKQLISLARAVLAQPDVFIMDEATSSVDTLTEALIQQGMESLMQGRTSFVIAHRLSTIRRANRILVIDKGRILEQGSHAELIRARGAYYQLYTRQFREDRARELTTNDEMALLVASA